MQLMQWNYYLEAGLLDFDGRTQRMSINYDRYDEVVGRMLTEVLAIQSDGDSVQATSFIERYGYWHPELHGLVAANIREAIEYRYYLMRYAVIDVPVH
jgi:hypothetical protein